MQFRLVYQGRLRSNGNLAHKQEIRRALHPQLRDLWRYPPVDSHPEWLADEPADGEQSVIQHVGAFRFAPLICETLMVVAELEIVFLRQARPGGLIRQGGDIDNQLKTLFDALRCPHSAAELPQGDGPQEDENPFYCLLDDDERILDLSVSVDRYLAPPDDRSVHVSMLVRTRPTRVTWGNVALL